MGEEKVKQPRPAYMVDVDETSGKQIHGTVRSATKGKPKLSQRESRSGKSSRKSHSDTGIYPGESSASRSQAVEVVKEKEGKSERRKSVSGSVKSPRKPTKPPLSHENRPHPKISIPKACRDDPSHFGIPTPTYGTPVVSQPPAPMQIPIRPRPLTTQNFPRPMSYHQPQTSTGAYAPPLSASAYYTQPPIITPSYPPPSPSSSFMRYAIQPPTPQADYFTPQPHIPAHVATPIARPLSARFDSVPRSAQFVDPINRTASAHGVRDTRRVSISDSYDDGYYEDSYASRASDGQVRRRDSVRGPSIRKQDADYAAMPPPPRPAGILRRPTIEYTADRYNDRDFRDTRVERPRYREESSPRRPSANRNSVSYDLGRDSDKVRIETANNGRRRQSYYGQSASTGSSGYEDKYAAALNQAASYQEDVAGPTIPLTADSLKKQQRRQAGSSRSTKSSGSRDESDYRKSVTTRTTRSGSGNDDENVTIKVSGQARVVVGGAQIDCGEGGEIRIERHQSIRGGSERSSSDYGGQRQIDDRRSRIDGRSSGRTRLSSANSYTRTAPPYDNYI